MSVIAKGFKIGSITLSEDYCMTATEMKALGSASGYPDVFPIWCTTDNKLYIYYKETDGTANIVDASTTTASTKAAYCKPTYDSATNTLSWTIEEVTGTAPDSMVLSGLNGKSAYEEWVAQGNTGTEADFLNSLKMTASNLSDSDITTLKSKLGITDALTEISTILNDINGTNG